MQKYSTVKFGRSLSPSELRLFHTISALLSARKGPSFDSQKGLLIFDRFLTRLDTDGFDRAIDELHPFQDKISVVYKGGKPTGIARLDGEGKPLFARHSQYVDPKDFERLRTLLRREGSVEAATDWLMARHPTGDVKALGRQGPPHEYIDGEEAYGMFGITGDKRGAYALNRNGKWDVIAKDIWFTRTVLRFLGKPLTTRAGKLRDRPLSKYGQEGRVRKLMDLAIQRSAAELGIEPALLGQTMFSYEPRIWSNLGAPARATSISQGVKIGIREIAASSKASEQYVLSGSKSGTKRRGVSQEAGGIGGSPRGGSPSPGSKGFRVEDVGQEVRDSNLAQKESGTYSPVSRIVRLVKRRANITTIAHEVAGHWLHDVLKDHPKWGAVFEKQYGKFNVASNRAGLERFAEDVEHHWLTSMAPRPEMSTVFDAIRGSFLRIYKRVDPREISPEIRSLFDEIDSVWDDEIAQLVKNFERVKGVETAKLELRGDTMRATGAIGRSRVGDRRDETSRSIKIDGGARTLRLTPDEWRQFNAALSFGRKL